MFGAILGDIIGSIYEWKNYKGTDFPLFSPSSKFTDDTAMTIATAVAILQKKSYQEAYLDYARRYPNAGYGKSFRAWFKSEDPQPYNSWGNGSAMRVSPIGFAFDDLETVLDEARKSAEVTHNHPEGIKGAQAVAAAIFMARTGSDKAAIQAYIETQFGYNLQTSLDEIRPGYTFDVSCQGSVPQAIRAFLESSDVESAIRLGVSIGGDSDTIASIAGGIAQAFYGVIPDAMRQEGLKRLPKEMQDVVAAFERYLTEQ